MPRLTVGTENTRHRDPLRGPRRGQPVVLIHGYPLNGHSWERQERGCSRAGYRVITYDRRGFGRSSQPTVGYDYDTFAADLDALIEHLDLDDAVLVGFSMGTGEVTRYLGTLRLGPGAQGRAARRHPAVPAEDRRQPGGRRRAGLRAASRRRSSPTATPSSRTSSTTSTTSTCWAGADQRAGVAGELQRRRRRSPFATYACVDTWLTDFRDDLPKIDVPMLVVHGTADRILPFEATAARLPALIDDLELVAVEGGPHNIAWTHPDEVNAALLEFIGVTTRAAA